MIKIKRAIDLFRLDKFQLIKKINTLELENSVLEQTIKYILIFLVWVFGMFMVKLYAPADTENVPILRKKDRRKKQILSYIALSVGLIVASFVPSNELANILIFGNLVQTLFITKFVYKITNNKYGYEVYGRT